ncbi:unnamed protein product [Meganyctiphanes norvegica]|uniref:Transmembrane protein n=1 Tax=Meganyctiphanes norvegica TaxID=48144 RepID=A0AAV2S850_MEGNR
MSHATHSISASSSSSSELLHTEQRYFSGTLISPSDSIDISNSSSVSSSDVTTFLLLPLCFFSSLFLNRSSFFCCCSSFFFAAFILFCFLASSFSIAFLLSSSNFCLLLDSSDAAFIAKALVDFLAIFLFFFGSLTNSVGYLRMSKDDEGWEVYVWDSWDRLGDLDDTGSGDNSRIFIKGIKDNLGCFETGGFGLR